MYSISFLNHIRIDDVGQSTSLLTIIFIYSHCVYNYTWNLKKIISKQHKNRNTSTRKKKQISL